jgi:hypothetical protein
MVLMVLVVLGCVLTYIWVGQVRLRACHLCGSACNVAVCPATMSVVPARVPGVNGGGMVLMVLMVLGYVLHSPTFGWTGAN